ncbi:Tuberous sclerosis 2-like protein [Rhizopus stolonifer]|uniref:Tuberous sclerosis 2-like protein n=1 Tax=Rhizopus stolonifer TaxID=4846 RepID=A0A367KKD4_RHIST|nr:Tuberous sclerosis 2-like protein [Rhizopus stolonifer]
MSSNSQKPSTTGNNNSSSWLSNILRPRSLSVSIESCLNITNSDPSLPLDARPILPLLSTTQSLGSRCKHLAAFSELCKSYKFTHLENVFFTVQDILESSLPREARHIIFEFMLACIMGQYSELGMARVTFYASLKNYSNWEDFSDMYRVLYALCKGGRDISGFEKNISKLLIQWLTLSIEKQDSRPSGTAIPYLKDLLHLLTVTAKFNFALFEEHEVTFMIHATHRAFFASSHLDDIEACLEFADVVVRYRFVPFDGLKLFLDILSVSATVLDQAKYWSIFQNLLRSHCAHSAILTLCRFLDEKQLDAEKITLMRGAAILLSETAWGKTGGKSEAYMVVDSVILMYFKRAVTNQHDTINTAILKALIIAVQSTENTLSFMDWDLVWDSIDQCILYILKMTDYNCNNDIHLFEKNTTTHIKTITAFSRIAEIIIQMYTQKSYSGPVNRLMEALYKLRDYCSDKTALLLMDYYVTEHCLLPSTDNWLNLLKEMAKTFFIHSRVSSVVRFKMLTIVNDVCAFVKDFYSEVIYESLVIDMMQGLPNEANADIRQAGIDLLVSSLSDCQNHVIFDKLVSTLRECARCHCLPAEEHRDYCIGVPAMCGLSELFENLLLASNGKLCQKTFDIIAEIANEPSDLLCPYGGPKIVALDLLLRLRCPTNHHIHLIQDNIVEEPYTIIYSSKLQMQRRKDKKEKRRKEDSLILGPPRSQMQQQQPLEEPSKEIVFYPNPNLVSYQPNEGDETTVLNINELLKAYIQIISDSPNWYVVQFLLKRLPQQLSNKHLFCGASPSINKLRKSLVKWTSNRKFLENIKNLPINVKRNDLAVHAYNLLTILISYRRIFTDPKQDQDEIVYAFYVGIMQVTPATRLCINSLAVCCYEMPLSVTKMLNEILQRMSQIISVSSVSVHILEFLSGLARLPNLYANFTGDMYKPVFAITLNYLQHSRSQQQPSSSSPMASPLLSSGPNSALNSPISPATDPGQGALKQYVLVMAYMVITVWFTSIPLRERRKHVPFIIQRLLGGNVKMIDEQTYTCIDMLSRFSFADVDLAPEKSIVSKILMGDHEQNSTKQQSQKTWVYGHTLLTLRTAQSVGWVEATVRRPSGTISMMCYLENKMKSNEIDYQTLPALLMMQYQPDLLANKILQENTEGKEEAIGNILSEPTTPSHPVQSISHLRKTDASIDPGFLYLQLNNYPDLLRGVEISPPLSNDESTTRTLATFDRIPVVDFHKIGVLYVGKNQRHEVEILANTYGSPDYVRFLNALGTIERLRGRNGNSGGLDREQDIDGRFAYFWKDDVTEAVFHIATLMPTHLDRDPQCSAKKRHIGNDYVTIVYNDSGLDYSFDTLPSQFNFINIVVSPHSISTEAISPKHALAGAENTFFKVEMQRRPDMPDIGPLHEPKLVSAQSLPGFVRQAAIHANIFAQVFWQSAGAKREYVTHWRERLRQILRVKERLTAKTNSAASTPSSTPNLNQEPNKSGFSVEALLDFTKYT